MGVSSPCSAMRSRACLETGAKGSSLISDPATTGIHSSSRPMTDRIIRVFA